MEHEEVSILPAEHRKDIQMTIASEQHGELPIAQHLYCNSSCAFAKKEYDILESEELSRSAKKLSGLIIFYTIVMIVEIIGGFKANSLAVMTDAAHLMTDVVGFSVSLVAVWVSGWKATSHQSFGFNRLEVLGALLSVQLIWVISGILIYEAIIRILHKNTGINGGLMLAISAFGFIVNLIMVLWLGHDHHHHGHHHHDHDHQQIHDHHHGHNHNHNHNHNLEAEDPCAAANEEEGAKLVSSSPLKRKISNINIEGAYLHVVADLIQSVGVMIAGAVIWMKPNWLVVDLICTLVFSTFVLLTTIPMVRNIFNILMEGTPSEIDVSKLESGLKCIEGVNDIHDLHIWAITLGKLVLSCHVAVDPRANSAEILSRIREYCEREYRIHHVTIQIEH
ncbi:metal tolerance protein B [Euphorbia lathyris]|uniref:metal tolerance protein B n=1 Tax=Euphorbia lathyris TaxID=212925 RepID=UPI003313BC1C